MMPLSLNEPYYPYSPSYTNRIRGLGVLIGVVGIIVGSCALKGAIPLSRPVSIFLCVGVPLTCGLIVVLMTSKNVYNRIKHGIGSVSLHHEQWKRSLNFARDQFDPPAGYITEGFANDTVHGFRPPSHLSSVALKSITLRATAAGQNQDRIAAFFKEISGFIDACSQNQRPIWVTCSLLASRNATVLIQTVTCTFFTSAT